MAELIADYEPEPGMLVHAKSPIHKNHKKILQNESMIRSIIIHLINNLEGLFNRF